MSSLSSPWRNTRVIVTGGLGFIGSNLAARCVELGATVTIYDCLAARSGANPANVAGVEHDLELVVGDIRSYDDVAKAMRGQDVCFHCAAHTSHVHSLADPFMDADVNARGALNVFEAARRVNPDVKIVHLATSTQVGPMRAHPIDESHAEFPLDIYSANKCISEKYALIYAAAHKLRATVVRLANVYGPRANVQSPHGGFVNYFVGLGLQNLPIAVYGHGGQSRNLVYVDDCVNALLASATTAGTDGQVYFAVSDRHVTIAEIAAAVERHIGGHVTHVDWPHGRQAIEVGDAVISPARIAAALHWSAQVDLDEGLQRTRAYFQPRLVKYLQREALAPVLR